MVKFPVCGACKRPFDDDTHKPRLLPCGHACCTACVSDMEDRDSTNCPEKKCGRDWSSKSLSDLPVVFDLIPESSGSTGGERHVTPASAAAGRDITPALQAFSLRPTGREVTPLDPEELPGSSASSCSGRSESLESNFPTCAVCMDDFNNNDNLPRLLACGHVSCAMCLNALERNGDLTCPRCRQVRPAGQVPGLPVVRTLIDPSNANKKAAPRAISSADILNRARHLQQDWMRRGPSPDKSDPKNMEIFVKDVRGQLHTFRVNPNAETVIALRQRLPGRPDSCRYLTFQGRTMENNSLLAEYNVRWHCTIEERGRLQGGAQPISRS